MAQKFEIQPYIGIGDIKFGMRPVDVDNLIGPPLSVKKDFLGERTEYRRDNGLLVTYSENQGVVEIGCSRNIIELEYDKNVIFAYSPLQVLKELVKIDRAPYEVVGFIVLLDLGMTLTGFHDGATEQMAVTVFAKGRWDDELPNMKHFDIEKLMQQK